MTIETDQDDLATKRGEVTVIVYAPRTPESQTFTFQRNERVGDAARTAAAAFGYEGGNPSFATEKNVVLDRTKSLEAEHVHDHQSLNLVDVGGGV
ncbi:MAG TPA: hypothetical protein VGS97_17080 [Actinocrinis sp.]|uniref:hypothetical protein n=1 Tax=Actinocrinis sp. TaxID=1920516 RepID=UPI002DDD9BCA|nr:hypothetical protein [Actinocrinis sp.]HEV2345816.1 hypothetical protein [Actinocrinis sp.]